MKPEHPMVALLKADIAAREALATAWATCFEAHTLATEALKTLAPSSLEEIRRALAHRGPTHESVMAQIACQAKGLPGGL